jgi:hypothetical protein
VLKGAHADLATAKQALLDSAKVMTDSDEAAAARMAQLQQKWDSREGFAAAQAGEEAAKQNEQVVRRRAEAATEAGQEAATEAGSDVPPPSDDDYPGSRTNEDGETQVRASR